MHVLVLASLVTQAGSWAPAPPLPRPVTNNAVAAVETSRGWEVYSFLGLDSTRRWDGVVTWAFRWTVSEPGWEDVPGPPGPGRLAATAQAVGGRIYLFGGYTVAEDGSERSVESVDIYDPETDQWRAGAGIPVPADDAVSGVWRDSLIYLVSGWHDRDNVAHVQIYDPATDSWRQATPIPGPPVFGHTGTIVGNTIVYLDGVRVDADPRRFSLERSAWLGAIDPGNPTRIAWRRLPDHPGPGLYRAAGGADDATGTVLIVGGTDNPYNYDGVGYDGVPSRPRTAALRLRPDGGRWDALAPLPRPVMDLRGVVRFADRYAIVGGMGPDQRVLRSVWVFTP